MADFRKGCTALALILLLSGVTTPAISATSQFVQATLAKGVKVSIPRSWHVLSGGEMVAVNTSAEAALDLTGIATVSMGQETLLAAALPDPNLYASVTVTVTPMPRASASTVALMRDNEIQEVFSSLRTGIEVSQRNLGTKISQWSPIAKVKVGARSALFVSYVRSSEAGDTIVQLYKFSGAGRLYDVALSTRVAMIKLNQPVMQRIVRSLVIPD